MPLLERFRKKEEKTEVKAEARISDFEQFCGDDKEVYNALYHTMFLDPRKIENSMKEAAESAKKLEKENNLSKAKIWYDIAGGLVIYEGNVKKVAEFFKESQRISGAEYPILKVSERAVAKAGEYYKTHLKS